MQEVILSLIVLTALITPLYKLIKRRRSPIKTNTSGTYILAHYQGGDNVKLREFDSWLKLSDLAIRHMIVKLDGKPDIVESLEEDKSENDTAEKGEDKSSDEKNLKKEKNKDEENKEAE